MGLIRLIRQWQKARYERRVEDLTAQAADLQEDQQYNLLVLYQRGFVRAKANGQSITRIDADVENLIRKKIKVTVEPGTYFRFVREASEYGYNSRIYVHAHALLH